MRKRKGISEGESMAVRGKRKGGVQGRERESEIVREGEKRE